MTINTKLDGAIHNLNKFAIHLHGVMQSNVNFTVKFCIQIKSYKSHKYRSVLVCVYVLLTKEEAVPPFRVCLIGRKCRS